MTMFPINLYSPATRETRRLPDRFGQLWQRHMQALLRMAVAEPTPLCGHDNGGKVWLCCVEDEPLLRCKLCADTHVEFACFYTVAACLNNCGKDFSESVYISDNPHAMYVWRAPGARYEIGVTCSWVCRECWGRAVP